MRSSVLLLCKKPLRAGAGLLAILGLLAVAGYAWNEFQFRAAVRALNSQKFAEGIKHLQLVWPKGMATHFLLARTLRRNSAFDDAEHELQGCEELGEAYTLEAVLLRVQQGELAGAESTLRQRAESDSAEAPLILEVLAQAYLRTYQFDRALDCINRLLKGQPNHVLALQWHGQMMEHINRREEAVEDYRRALAVNPDDKSARLSLGDLLLNLNRYADSLEQFDYLRRRWPDDPAVLPAASGVSAAPRRPGNCSTPYSSNTPTRRGFSTSVAKSRWTTANWTRPKTCCAARRHAVHSTIR